YFFFPAEDGIRDFHVTGVQTCALPISDDDDLYFAGRPAPFDLTSDPGGFYRVSRSGGAPQQVIREYITQTSGISDFILDGDRARSEERRVGKESRSRSWS